MARIVPARVNEARVVSGAVLDARAQAQRIIAEAKAEAARLRTEAERLGFEAGRIEALAGQLDAATARDRAVAQAEPLVARLALAVAEKLFHRALTERPERVLDVVRPLLAQVRGAHQVELRMHPDDRAVVRAWLDGALGEAAHSEALQLVDDASLGRGDCVIITDHGNLDARVDVQLAAFGRALGSTR